jgi:hypothetical protein
MFPNLDYFVHSVLFYFEIEKVPSKKNRIGILHLHHVTISISMILLLNTIKFGFVPAYGKKKVEECGCKVPSRGWILGI